MTPQIPERALDVWAIVTPSVQITVVVAVVATFCAWLWHRIVVKRIETMPDRRSSGVPSEVLIQILEEISRNQAAVTVAIEHNTEAIESLRDLVRKNRCAYRHQSVLTGDLP